MKQDWVEVYMTALEHRATIAKDLLENEGIKAIVLNQKDSAHQSFGDFLVHVQKTNQAKAVEILKKLKH